jgi:hypothetical protein
MPVFPSSITHFFLDVTIITTTMVIAVYEPVGQPTSRISCLKNNYILLYFHNSNRLNVIYIIIYAKCKININTEPSVLNRDVSHIQCVHRKLNFNTEMK